MNRQSAAFEQEWLAIDLSGAFIRRADLSGASLNQANFSGADCTNANFSGADFEGAILEGTILKGADLRGARNLTRQQIQSAIIDHKTLLPDGLL
jgi:uncharacterized protein YjbI with pentapeptide repeats